MIVISTLLVLIFCCSIGAQSTCLQTPTDPLPRGCKIGNLKVISSSSFFEEDIIVSNSCDQNTSTKFFRFPPSVFLPSNYSRASNSNITYLLIVIDRTNGKLVWMVSDLTINSEEEQFDEIDPVMSLNANNPLRSRIIKEYSQPNFGNFTTIEFLVFEEHRLNASKSYVKTNATHSSSFNLSAWIDAQHNSHVGIAICGPVAGGSVMAIKETLFFQLSVSNYDQYFSNNSNTTPKQSDNSSPEIKNEISPARAIILCIIVILVMLKMRWFWQQTGESNERSDLIQLENVIPMSNPGYPAPK